MKRFSIYHGAIVLLLMLTAFCLTRAITPGHIMNGDYALYIRQAQSILHGDIHRLAADMQTMLGISTYQRYSPVLYPWGFPLLLAPLVAFRGLDYVALKWLGALCLLGALWFLSLNFSRKRNCLEALFTVFLVGLNTFYLLFGNVVLSELPYLLFVMLSLYTIDRVYGGKNRPAIGGCLIVGFLLFASFQLRTEGIILFASLFATQFSRWMEIRRQKKPWVKRDFNCFILPYIFAGVLFGVFTLCFPAGFMAHTSHLKIVAWERILHNLWVYFTLPGKVLGIPGVIGDAAVWLFTVIGIKNLRRNYPAEITYVLFAVLFLLIWPYGEMRYFLSVLPFVFFFGVRGILAFSRYGKKQWARWPAYFFLAGLVVSVGADTGRNMYTGFSSFDSFNMNVEGKNAQEMFRYIRTHSRPDDVVACCESRTMYLYTGRLSGNFYGDVKETMTQAQWYVSFVNRDEYLQYKPDNLYIYRKYLKKVFSNDEFVIYKIYKP